MILGIETESSDYEKDINGSKRGVNYSENFLYTYF